MVANAHGEVNRKIASALIMILIIASGMLVFFPLSMPTVKAVNKYHGQIADSNSAQWEDNNDPLGNPVPPGNTDFNGDISGDGIVTWHDISGADDQDDHYVVDNFVVEDGYTLQIEPLDFVWTLGTGSAVIISNGVNITIQSGGELQTNTDGGFPFLTLTPFSSAGTWDGIYVEAGGKARIIDSLIINSDNGVQFESGSEVTGPGIVNSIFTANINYDLYMDGATGVTNIGNTIFDPTGADFAGTSAYMANCQVNITDCSFSSHGMGQYCLYLNNTSDAKITDSNINGATQMGGVVYADSTTSTVFKECTLTNGSIVGSLLECINGASPLLENCTLGSGGLYSVYANGGGGGGGCFPVILNGSAEGGGPFDNSTIYVTGDSAIKVQWWVHVYCDDGVGAPVSGAIVNTYNNTYAVVASGITGADGFLYWNKITEFVDTSTSRDIYNPFNVTASAGPLFNFTVDRVDMSKTITVLVDVVGSPNNPPSVQYLEDLSGGLYGGEIAIDFILEDWDLLDQNSLQSFFEYSTDNVIWDPCTPAAGSDPASNPSGFNLQNDTLYTFIWDSATDLGQAELAQVWIRLTPSDDEVSGISSPMGSFALDNLKPSISDPTVVTRFSDTVTIQWTANESSDATVWYGLDGILTGETTGSSGSTSQEVTLTGLMPGRNYSYATNSTDAAGNTNSSADPPAGKIYTFSTKYNITLVAGWNMISVMLNQTDTARASVLSSITGQYTRVQRWDAADLSDHWKSWVEGKPFGNDLTDLDQLMGIWIYITPPAGTTLEVDGEAPYGTYSNQIPLIQGWNYVSYPSVTERTPATALGGLANFRVVWHYDSSLGQWTGWDDVGTETQDDLASMKPGEGYWIYMNGVEVWNLQYV
ncbi:MAG: hypothetical protein JSW28_10060 [Thermoplasmata archaeon]|nr:MAG: hypothetical protein JSW28_10060 [Thermoplasmata archaeon]